MALAVISRRAFLLDSAGAAAGMILPAYYQQALEFLERTGQPLLVSPAEVRIQLLAERWPDGRYGLMRTDLDGIEDNWQPQNPLARAYRLLAELDLGPEFDGDHAGGYLEFIRQDAGAEDYWCVDAVDEISLSLLQRRLNDMDAGVRILAI